MITNKNCILRLSRYKNAIGRLKSLGFVKVFSDNLGDAVGVTSAQVRKDFSLFGISGKKRGGYNIDDLLAQLNKILGKNEIQKTIIAGAGSLGSALLKYQGFEKEGIKIAAGFDIDPAKFSKKGLVPILPLDDMRGFIRSNEVRIGIISVPDIAAQQVLDIMSASGIKGVLNFAPIRLRAPQDCIITYVNLELELENLIYFVNVKNPGCPS